MHRAAALLVLGLGLAAWQYRRPVPPNPEMQLAEIMNLEHETARAIQLNNVTFFRDAYSDDYSGTLSYGQTVNKAQLIEAVRAADHKFDSFKASDIKVRIYRETALVTCLWTSRGTYKGQPLVSQMRVLHVYVYGLDGWNVVASQTTPLPPYTDHPL